MSTKMSKQEARAARFTGLLWLLFKRLNDEGIFAEQFVACCNTCGWKELTKRYDDYGPDEGVVGFAYTHEQNRDEVEERAEVHIGYGNLEGGLSGEEVAAFIVKIAETVPGLRADWGGSIETKVRVYLGAAQ